MKPSSPLSLLLFLSPATSGAAAPIPPFAKLHKDCLNSATCQIWLRESFSPEKYFFAENGHTPPTRLTTPRQFLKYESTSALEVFDNAPLTPPKDFSPTIALSALRPLHSSYLLSLSNSNPSKQDTPDQSTSSQDALPSKPTSALPKLREEDTRRYWATVPNHSQSKDVEERQPCKGTKRPNVLAREYSDLLVVGIVVLFLAAVVVMEAVDYFGDLSSGVCCWTRRKGEIFLPDDEKKDTPISVRSSSMSCRLSLGIKSEDAETGEYHD